MEEHHMTNAIISLTLALAITATLGSQIATTTYRATAVRATLAGWETPHVAQQPVHANRAS